MGSSLCIYFNIIYLKCPVLASPKMIGALMYHSYFTRVESFYSTRNSTADQAIVRGGRSGIYPV